MKYIETPEQLSEIYGTPKPTSIRKVAPHLTPAYREWIARSRFCVLSTVGPEGTDASPRGDDGPVVTELDQHTLALADWRGNNRTDSLQNILRDPRVSLMFMVAGSNNVVRVNGQARITADPKILTRFETKGRLPRTITIIRINEVYFQCSRALLRSKLWTSGDDSQGLPTAGQILADMTAGELGGKDYDRKWQDRAAISMW